MSDNLFFSVWRNKYLNNLIFTNLQLYNSHYHSRLFDIEEINKFEFKGFCNSVKIINIKENHVPILSSFLPQNVKQIEFGDEDFNFKIEKSTFSSLQQLESIKFNDKFDQEIIPGSLPNTLRSLEFGFYMNQKLIKNSLPTQLKKLILGYNYNQEIEESILPSTLEYLDLGFKNENQIKIGVLPQNLKILKFGHCFNERINIGVLPLTLKYLDLGSRYNKKFIKGAIPNGLEVLKLSSHFNKPCNNLPFHSLKSLYIGRNFDNIIFNENNKFENLETLEFGMEWMKPLNDESTFDIKYMGNFKQPIKKNDLPASIKTINLNNHYCESFGNKLIEQDSFASNLIELSVTDLISTLLIPSSVKILNIKNCFNKPIESSQFPSSITHLKFNSCFNQTLQQGCFKNMKNLESLQLLLSFNNGDSPLIKGIFPNSLKYLEVGIFFNQDLANSLTYTNIEHLVLGEKFNSTLRSSQLPKSLKSLFIKNSNHFDYKFESNSLPQSLELLYLDIGVKQDLSNEWLNNNLKYLIIIGNQKIKSLPKNLKWLITHGNNYDFINNFKSQFNFKDYITLLKVYSYNHLKNNNVKDIMKIFYK